MKQIFLDIRDIILDIKDSNHNQIIKYFDLWNRQLEFLAEELKITFYLVSLHISNSYSLHQSMIDNVVNCFLFSIFAYKQQR